MRLARDPLVAINLEELLDSIGFADWALPLLRPLLRPAAWHFARTVRAFDDRVGAEGLAAGSAWLVARMTGGLQVAGRAHLPAQGPLLVLANHPGMTDTVALFASLQARPDLRVIAQDRAFLRALPHVAAQVDFVSDDGASRTKALRAGIRHLQQGGALLTFPAGSIEPDPAAAGVPAALASLQGWSASFTLFTRAVERTRVVPALVSQVISPAAARNPLLRLRRTQADRDKLAASLQILWPGYRALPARVAFGAPITTGQTEDLHQAVVGGARALVDLPAQAWETWPDGRPA